MRAKRLNELAYERVAVNELSISLNHGLNLHLEL